MLIRVLYARHLKKAGLNNLPLIQIISSAFVNRILSFRLRNFMLGLSDPMSITWAGTSDSLLTPHFGLVHMGLSRSRYRDYPYIGLILFTGILKRLGYIKEVQAFCLSLSETSTGRVKAIALRELGDIEHLHHNWFKQLADPHRENVFFVPSEVFAVKDGAPYEAHLTHVSPETVLDYYRRAQEADPTFAWLGYEIARLNRDAGRLEQAIEHHLRAAANGAGEIPRLVARQIQYLLDGDRPAYQLNFPDLPGIALARYSPKRVRLAAMSDLSDDRHDVTTVWDEMSLDIDYRTSSNRETVSVAKTISYPALGYGRFTNLRRLGHPFSLVDEETLLTDTIHFHPPNYPMFNTHLLATDKNQAVVTLHQTPNFPGMAHVHEPVILLGGGAKLNYFHTIFEALGSLALIENENFFPDRCIMLNRGAPPWLMELMAALGITNDLLSLAYDDNDASKYVFHDALQVACPSKMTVPHPLAIDFLRRRLYPKTCRPKPGKYLHLDRTSTRSIDSGRKKEFHTYLESQGFEIVEPGTMSIREQVELYKDAEIVSALGGAALSNLLFAPQGCKVIVVAPTTHVYEIWSVVTKCLGQKLWMCLTDPAAQYPNPYYLWCGAALEYDIATYQACLNEAIGSQVGRSQE